ncbi:TonB-dependent siderophore receptor [Paraflavitalea pollutisoli]|uniref:TonB-dependent siderophore receptor n=1 Tax=Paraflavitalea pollutisoli TaxID=3034143 RepID=UPI0023EBBAAA|nr:TonB-dependent siderophore receptor [Paraflavitalea sp. H1-2-19X]
MNVATLRLRQVLFALAVLFLSLLPFSTWCQSIPSIKGLVVTSDGKPASYVTISLSGKHKPVITNDSGVFVMQQVPPGNYVVSATLVGHQPVQQAVQVEAGKTSQLTLHLNTSENSLSEVIVSANAKSYIAAKASTSLRLNAELIEIPQNITVATRQTLTDMGLLTKSEIFRISSAITKSYGSELDLTFQIRGMDATYGTYRNGVGGPIWWNAQEDAAMIERMEFVKGPAGFMLSNAEPGGLVNVVTKQPTRQRITEVGFGIGSWNMMRTYADLGGEFVKDGKLSYRFNIGAEKKNEYYQFGDFYRYWICPVIKYDFSEHTSITLEHNYVKAAALANSQYSVTINEDFKALPVDLAVVDPNLNKFWGADVYNRVHLKHKFNEDWTLNVQAAHMTTDWDGTTMYPEGLSPTKDTLYRYVFSSDWTGKLTNMQLFADGKFFTGRHIEHKVLLGIDYGNGSEGSTSNGNWGENKYPLALQQPIYYLPKADFVLDPANETSWLSTNKWQALYVQDHIKVYDKLIVTLAGRYTQLKTGQDYVDENDPKYEVTDNKFTPRLGLTYLFTPNLSAYVMHDESFLSQRGAIFGGGRLPALIGSNNEIGVKALLFNRQLSVTASVYDMRKNEVGTADFAHPGFFLKTGQIRSTGLDLDIAGKINANLYVNINYAYVDPLITKDEDETLIGIQNAGTCRNLANAWVKYQINSGVLRGLGLGAGMQYTDKRGAVSPGWNHDKGNRYLPAYTLFDAALSYTTGKFSVNLNAYNLANKRYATGGWWYPEFGEYLFYQGTPANFRLQTTFRL